MEYVFCAVNHSKLELAVARTHEGENRCHFGHAITGRRLVVFGLSAGATTEEAFRMLPLVKSFGISYRGFVCLEYMPWRL